jgi:nicotinamide-nucleotide amidase
MQTVIKTLTALGATVATAESCTGGRIAAALTEQAGASEYFAGGIVAYSNSVKINVLGVDPAAIDKYGAVSRPVAEQMALGALRVTGADWAVATTGIAGPGGGTKEKPVGTLWVAVAGAGGVVAAREFHLTGDSRTRIMAAATDAALELLAGEIARAKARARKAGFNLV